MPVSLPNPLTDGTTAFGSHVKANDDAIAGKFSEGSNGIADGDVSASAAIKGSKLSNVAGNRIPTDRIEDDAVNFDKLKDDAAVSANRAVGRNHIQDAAVDKLRVSTTAGEKLVTGNLDIRTQTLSFNGLNGGFRVSCINLLLEVVSSNYRVRATVGLQIAANNILQGSGTVLADAPSPAIVAANNVVLAVHLLTFAGHGTDTWSGTCMIVYMPNA